MMLDSFRNFAYVTIYLRLKSFTWKRDCPISLELQTSQNLPGTSRNLLQSSAEFRVSFPA